VIGPQAGAEDQPTGGGWIVAARAYRCDSGVDVTAVRGDAEAELRERLDDKGNDFFQDPAFTTIPVRAPGQA